MQHLLIGSQPIKLVQNWIFFYWNKLYK